MKSLHILFLLISEVSVYASITSPVVLLRSSHFPPAPSIAALAAAENAFACTVISFAVKSPFPTTTLWMSSLDLVTVLDSRRLVSVMRGQNSQNLVSKQLKRVKK